MELHAPPHRLLEIQYLIFRASIFNLSDFSKELYIYKAALNDEKVVIDLIDFGKSFQSFAVADLKVFCPTGVTACNCAASRSSGFVHTFLIVANKSVLMDLCLINGILTVVYHRGPV